MPDELFVCSHVYDGMVLLLLIFFLFFFFGDVCFDPVTIKQCNINGI